MESAIQTPRSWSKAFDNRSVTDETAKHLEALKNDFGKLADNLDTNLPEGRYKDLVRLRLEEACIFAIKSVTHQ